MIRRAATSATTLALLALISMPLAAQDRSSVPTDVKIVGDGTTATVTWTAVPFEGVTYRVLRNSETEKVAVDMTKPVSVTSFVDPRVGPGLIYFYQVIAVFRDGVSAAAEPVQFTAPPAPTTGTVVASAPRTFNRAMPVSAVTGVAIAGTVTAAQVSWQPVTGAISYSVLRVNPQNQKGTSSALTTTSWNDTGTNGAGFPVAGVYQYVVTASLPNGASVSGQASWTRPNASCAAPPATQPMLASLSPKNITTFGGYPGVVAFIWSHGLSSPVMAYILDRSIQGTDTWTRMGTTCEGTLGLHPSYEFVDRSPAIVPTTTYLYRLTALATNADAGVTTIPWTAPNPSIMRWLSATATGNTVTMRFRYEAPPANAPELPSDKFSVTSPYGLNQVVQRFQSYCASYTGCELIVNGVPSGTHVFTVTAFWPSSTNTVTKTSAETTVIVP